MTKKMLSLVIAGTLAATPLLSFAENMSTSEDGEQTPVEETSSSVSSSSNEGQERHGLCVEMKGRDLAACLRVRNLKVRAQRTVSRSANRKEMATDKKKEHKMEKQQKDLRKLLRRNLEAVTKACGSTRGLERIQCIKNERNGK